MKFLSDILYVFQSVLSEKLLTALRILSGGTAEQVENRSDTPDSTTSPDIAKPPAGQPEDGARQRMSSNRLGWYGKR